MRHTLPLPERCLAAVLFTAIGLGAFGCGDSATVNPVVELASLSVGLTNGSATLQPGFSGGTTQYRVDVTTDVPTVTVTAQAAVAGDTVTIDGQRTTSRSITLDPPGSTTVINVVVSEADTNSRTYVIRVVRASLAGNNSLENLTVSPGPLAPTFDENLQSYTASVANNIGSVTVTPTLSDPAATMTVNGQATNSGQARTITLNGGGQNTTITIIVTAQNGNSKTYVVDVSRGRSNNNNLQSLGISPGPLSPTFRAGTTGYTVNLPATLANTVTTVRVTPRLQDTAATMTVNGQTATSGQARTTPLPAPGSNNFINIVVVAQDGTPKTYTVNVIREALGGNNSLSGLTVSPGTLAPTFDENLQSYTASVANNVGSVTVTPTLSDPAATMTVNGQATNSGEARTFTLNGPGQNTTIAIIVAAQNRNQKNYLVTVSRGVSNNNNLQSLGISPGTLSPAFRAGTTVYTVNLPATLANNVTNVTVTPRLQDTAATMSVNGQTTTSGQARTTPLPAPGSNNFINIVVVAQDGTPKTYTVNVIRAALGGNNNLQSLTVSPGTLSPAFTAARIPYTVSVGSSDTSILVEAAPQDPSATVEINQQAGNSRSIPLPTGPSTTEIEIRVIAPNGTDKTYLITVNQPAPAAPPAPASAPDLIEADDSCEPDDTIGGDPTKCSIGTSKDDNVTKITTPGFSIPSPGAGVTPKLWVNGVKDVNSTFTQGILRRSTSFSEGTYTITYNLTNDVGGSESGESPPLDPPLRIITTPPPPPTP